jgi:dihydropteroate synthase
MKLVCREKTLSLDRTLIMGILNVTPDSFSDGGLWSDPERAVQHGLDMVAEGADVIDVGGESTRPGAEPVPEEEELRRVLPVIEALGDAVDVPISIDTRKASVARRAVAAGAVIVNDTCGERSDGSLDEVVAGSGAGVVVMHSRGTPATMRSLTQYDDVAGDVAAWLASRVRSLEDAGVARDSIVIDPGIGFAKEPAQNLELLHNLSRIVAIGLPVLVGTSRKSFIGEVLGLPVDRRLEGTIATIVWAVFQGAHVVRVHEVEPIARALRIADAIRADTKAW